MQMLPNIQSPIDALVPEPPSTLVAFPMGADRALLGLDRALPLLGGGVRLEPTGMSMALGIDHVTGLRSFVADACRRQVLAARDWYHQPPLALFGTRGVGKGMVADWIARQSGVPLFRATASQAAGVSDARWGYEHRYPTLPMVAMAASRCANPMIVVELDVLQLPAVVEQDALATMMDPHRSARWMDTDLGTILDFSQISWIIEVQTTRERDAIAWYDGLPHVPPELPSSFSAVFEDAGTSLWVKALKEQEGLRRLNVAIEACAAASEPNPEALTRTHEALMLLESETREDLTGRELFQHAQWTLRTFQERGTG